jgi:nucleoside-diphosphate-sugar epimerase
MNITITGGSGFLGKNLNSFLLSLNKYEVRNIRININDDFYLDDNCLINLIGKAHDFKKNISFSEYYNVNTVLSNKVFDSFLASNAKVFITISSVKAVADSADFELTEETMPNPVSFYGISKLFAEQYILSKQIPDGKRVYILRPCMVHGPGNKGNLNLLYKIISRGFPWPLGAFENSRSFLSIDNLCFIINEIIERDDIPSGVYNVADDTPLSTNQVVSLFAEINGGKNMILKIPKNVIKFFASLGEYLKLPLDVDRFQKLTQNYVVSNVKIKSVLGKTLPVSSKDGLMRTFQSFSYND